MKKLLGLCVLSVATACGSVSDEPPAADFLFTNANVITMNEAAPRGEAVAVIGNKIVYVGDAAGAEAFIGADTTRFDLDGKILTPGFVSTHEHLIASGWRAGGAVL